MTLNVVQFTGESSIGFTARISECNTSYDILRLTREIASAYGFDYFMIVRMPRDDERSLSSLSIINNWPPELIQRCDQLGLLEKSRVFSAMQRSTRPIHWRAGEPDREGSEGEGAALFAAYGVNRSISFSVQEASGQRGIISFSGKRDAPSEKDMVELSYISNMLYEKISEFRKPEPAIDQLLTGRERECLHWTAGGKTSSEIASILGLSEHTVNHYLSATCQKLGAANRAHAVAKAMRAGLLD